MKLKSYDKKTIHIDTQYLSHVDVQKFFAAAIENMPVSVSTVDGSRGHAFGTNWPLQETWQKEGQCSELEADGAPECHQEFGHEYHLAHQRIPTAHQEIDHDEADQRPVQQKQQA